MTIKYQQISVLSYEDGKAKRYRATEMESGSGCMVSNLRPAPVRLVIGSGIREVPRCIRCAAGLHGRDQRARGRARDWGGRLMVTFPTGTNPGAARSAADQALEDGPASAI